MRTYLGGLAVLVAGLAPNVGAQYQTVIAPPPGGVPIVAGGYYTSGTVFANGMAYPNGMPVQDVGMIAQASYAAPVASYPSFGSGYYGGAYPQNSYYGTGYPSFGLGISFGNVGYGYGGYGLGSYPNYGGYSNFGSSYGRGYTGGRGHGGGGRGHGGGRRR